MTGLINEEVKKEQNENQPQKIGTDPGYKDIKRADESADNDMDRIAPQPNDDAKKATDEAYMKDQTGSGTGPSSGRR